MLSASINTVAPRVRSNAPIGVEVTLRWSGTGIQEGYLDLTLHDGNAVLSELRSGDLALTGGSQTFRLTLPPPRVYGFVNHAMLNAVFVGRNGRIDLGSFPIGVSSFSQRYATIAVSTPRAGYRAATYDSRTLQSLRIEMFDPAKGDAERQGVSTSVAYLNTDDLPVNPLVYCQFDLVFVGEEGFTGLKEKQLEALARWVEGGGSVLVVPRGKLQVHHLAFLNRLAGTAGKPLQAFDRNPDGELAVSDRDAAGMRNQVGMYRSELGRSVIALELPTEEDLNMAAWRRVTLFLWKFTVSSAGRVVNKGTWSEPDANFPNHNRRAGVGQAVPLTGGAELMRALMPQSTRMIPLAVILLILGGFVLVIGPLDYFGLGLIRARRFTWVMFPVMSVVFTVSTMQLAAHYMGRNDHRNKVTIVDVGAGGKVLRQNTVEVIFAAREKTVTTEVKNALWSVVSRFEMSAGNDSRYYGGVQREDDEVLRGQYRGQYPLQYALEQPVRQWSPIALRSVSFEPVADMPKLDWDGVEPLLKPTGRLDFVKILSTLGATGRDYTVCWQRLGVFNEVQRGGWVGLPQVPLQNLCARQSPVGLFSLVSQVSPVGGLLLEDVAVLDPTDPQQWLFVVVEKKGKDYVVYRRLYHGRE